MPNLVLPSPPSCIRPLTDEQSTWLRTRYPDISFSPANCVTCGGKKTFNWYAPRSREQIETYDCDCPNQFLLHRVMLHSGIGLNFQRLGWDDFTYLPDEHHETIANYIAGHENYVNAGIGLIAYGPMGNGKSMLANLALKGLLSFGHNGFYTTFSELLNTISGGWKDKDERQWFYRQVKNAGVLVIDDLGRESKREVLLTRGEREASGAASGVQKVSRDWVERSFEEVVRHRVANSKPTIITTNLDIDNIESGYGANVLSLLRERCFTMKFQGEDRRNEMRSRFITEASKGLRRPVVLG